MNANLWRRFTLLLVFFAFGFFLSGCSRVDFSPFDYEKYKNLNPDKRREYDVIFFNEIVVWNMNSNRYGKGINDSYMGRKAEFEHMAEDGYLPAYVALRLLDIERGNERSDPDALNMLLKAADTGDASAMCSFIVMPLWKTISSDEERRVLVVKMKERGLALKHPACMAYRGGDLYFGNASGIPQDTQAAMPLLFEAARQGYYVAARTMFSLRYQQALAHKFDFSNLNEFKRALCWGRLAEQHTNWAGFDAFIGQLKDYARLNARADLLEISYPYDPRRIPITQAVVKPDDCIQLEQGK